MTVVGAPKGMCTCEEHERGALLPISGAATFKNNVPSSSVFQCTYDNCESTLRRSLVTPIAVTSPPAPAPWMIRGLLPYRFV